MDITKVRKAIVTTLSTSINGLEFYATVPDAPIVPCAIVYPDSINYTETFDDLTDAIFTIHLLGAAIDAVDGQETLDSYLASSGPLSIKQVIERSPDLGGAVADCWVTELRDYGTVQPSDGGSRFYSAQLLLQVHG